MMKFAFAAAVSPDTDPAALAQRAKDWGYDGVELLLPSTGPIQSPAQLREPFDAQSIAISCLSTDLCMTGHKRKDQQSHDAIKRALEMASALGCPRVKIGDALLQGGHDRAATAGALAQWLAPLADDAERRNLLLLIENRHGFRAARDIWTVLEFANHPALACCWNVFTAAQAGESPAVSVPVLNSRIQYVRVKDATLPAGPGAPCCKLGDGNVPVQSLMNRLRGIGYAGWVSCACEDLPASADAGELLPDALTKLRQWAQPPAEKPAAPAKADAKPAAAKAPAKV